MKTRVLAVAAVLAALAGAALAIHRWQRPSIDGDGGSAGSASRLVGPTAGGGASPESAAAAARDPFTLYAGSESCRDCHPRAYEAWKGSHHALAERPLLSEHLEAFDPPRSVRHGTQTSEARLENGEPVLATIGPDGQRSPRRAIGVFGVAPLWQVLIPVDKSRVQVSELAYDPAKMEWFDVYGDEDREPGEWGHWSGRGMNWNSMCAVCHNTRLIKGYDEKSDGYDTRRAEMGVGCEACHGPLRKHVEWQRRQGPQGLAGRRDPHMPPSAPEATISTCGSCHSRRTELTGGFVPGESFLDHYVLVITDESSIYHPDGQVHEEDFEYASFLSSRMHHEGVRCMNCHEPHSAKTRFQGNELCLQCHRGKIDPALHSHHAPGTPGGNCVDCHMPLTSYMQRHPRRDHGFTIPDPLLTREHGVPNACNRCHADRSVDWAIASVDAWYGERMRRRTRERAEAIAEARAGKPAALERLLGLAQSEAHPFWRAVIAGLLKLWPLDDRVRAILARLAADAEPLVRTMAARALDAVLATSDDERAAAVLDRLLRDPVRAVRVEAAWARRRAIDPGSRAGAELWSMLKHNLDQPGGALRIAQYSLDRGQVQAALPHLARAVQWDPRSPVLRHARAVALSLAGDAAGAVEELQAACRLAPNDAGLALALGLALNEAGSLDRAIEAFERTVALDPRYPRAWYNLGVARMKLGLDEAALAAARKAEEVDPQSPEPPYLRASIHFEAGRRDAARAALEETLARAPGYQPAVQLLEVMEGEGK